MAVFLSLVYMEVLRIETSNVSGGGDVEKRAALTELIRNKNTDVLFLQETHGSVDHKVQRGMNWEGQLFLRHDTNLHAGGAVLFSKRLNLTKVTAHEVDKTGCTLTKHTTTFVHLEPIKGQCWRTSGSARTRNVER